MAQIIEGGSDVFDALLYGKQHPGTSNFLKTQIEDLSSRMTEAGSRFFERGREIYDRVSGSTAARFARAASRQFSSLWQEDVIRSLTTTAQLQTAPLAMQRWIMAEPTIRSLFHKQRCDGYEDTYVDAWPHAIGEEHYDWRRVNNGVVHFTKDEEGEETEDWYATTYMEDLLPDDEDLMFEEQVDILDTWANVVSAIRAGDSDPTSKWDAPL